MFFTHFQLILSQNYVIIKIQYNKEVNKLLSVAIYSDYDTSVEQLKSIIQDFLIETKMMAKVSYFNDPEALMLAPSSFDIYIMDMDSEADLIELSCKMRTIDAGAKYIFISSNESHAYKVTKARFNYFMLKPIDVSELIQILKEIKQIIKDDTILIKVAGGERRIRVNHLNYINIVKRCLCYHLTDGTMFDGQTLRSSFEKAIDPLHKHRAFLFLSPSLLINIGEIKIVNSDNIVFENDDVLFFPKKQYEMVRSAWINYNRILN